MLRRRRTRRNRRGFLLIVGMFAIAGALTLTAVGLSRSMTDLLVSTRFVSSQQAFHLAEADVEDVLLEYRTGSGNAVVDLLLSPSQLNLPDGQPHPELHDGWVDATNDVTNPTADSACPAGVTCYAKTVVPLGQLGPNTLATVLVIDPTANAPRILARARAGATAQIDRRVGVTGTRIAPSFDHAFYGGDYLRVGSYGSGLVSVDSYNSTLGAYNPITNKGAKGNIGSNDRMNVAQIPDGAKDVQLQTTVRLEGIIHQPAWAEDVFMAGSRCNGNQCDSADVSIMPPIDLPPVVIPQSLTALACGGKLTVSGVITPLAVDTCVTQVEVINGGTLQLKPNVRLYLKGTGNPNAYLVNVTGTGQIEAQGNNKIYGERGRFWVRSKFGLVNDRQTPRDLQVRVKGNDTIADRSTGECTTGNYHGLEQEAPFYGVLYIQDGFLWVKGNADAGYPGGWSPATEYGALVSGGALRPSTHGSQPFTFHYDESVADIPITGVSTYYHILSWRDLAPGEAP